MTRKLVITIIFIFLLPKSDLFAITKSKHYNINRPKDTKDIQYPHNNWELLEDLGMGVVYSLSAGFAAVHGNIPGAVAGAYNGTKNFLKVSGKYQENLQFEREVIEKSYNSYAPMEKEYDQSYNVYDLMTR